MALDSYTNLQIAIADWLDRTDLSAQIPDFISLAESWMRPECQVMWLEDRARKDTTAGDATLSLPSDFNGMRSVHIEGDPKTQLEQVSLPYLRKLKPSSSQSKPKYFAVGDNQIILGPVPDSAYQVRMAYYKFPVLSASQASNAILEKHPDMYLYGALSEAAIYLRDDQAMMLYSEKKFRAMDRMKGQDRILRYGTTLATKVG